MRKITLLIRLVSAMTVLFCVSVFLSILSIPAMGQNHEGEDINISNKTGHEVQVFMFQDSDVHLDESGGVQVASLKDGEISVAHVPYCVFCILLVDNADVWHAEFHDCHTTEVLFTPTTGYAKKD